MTQVNRIKTNQTRQLVPRFVPGALVNIRIQSTDLPNVLEPNPTTTISGIVISIYCWSSISRSYTVLCKAADVIGEHMEQLNYIISGLTLSAVSVIGLVGNLLLFILITKQVNKIRPDEVALVM